MHDVKITDIRAIVGDSAFLIDDGKTSIMYDSGFAFTGYKVAQNIRNILGERTLDYIFLTHSHYDHALGAAYAKKIFPSAKIVAGEYAAKIFAKPTAKAVMRDLDNKFATTCGVNEYEDLIDELSIDIAVADGDKIQAGDMEFTAISLPGHTKCSIGFYLAENKLLLGCETLGVFGGDEIVVPSYLVGIDMALSSIEKAEKLDIDTILCPHYGVLDRNQTKTYFSLCKKNAVEVAEKIKEIIQSGQGDEAAVKYFMDKYYHGYVKEIYPIDAITLNTNIMVKLVKRELLGME